MKPTTQIIVANGAADIRKLAHMVGLEVSTHSGGVYIEDDNGGDLVCSDEYFVVFEDSMDWDVVQEDSLFLDYNVIVND